MTGRARLSTADTALELVDLERYPIHDLDDGAGAGFLEACQQSMEVNGWCNLDGFIRPDALARLAIESTRLLPTAEVLTIKRNIYQGAIDSSLPEDDPRRREFMHVAVQLADDQIPGDTLIKQLYHSDILTEFVRRAQMKPRLYRCADEFQALNIVALQPESWHAWHYDTTECTVTLLLQAAESGANSPSCLTHATMTRKIVRPLTGCSPEIFLRPGHFLEAPAHSRCFVEGIRCMG